MDFLPTEPEMIEAPGTPGNPDEILVVIPGRNFDDDEYLLSRAVFDEAVERSGNTLVVRVVSSADFRARGVQGTWVEVDRPLAGLDLSRCAALVFTGGPGAAEYFSLNTAVSLAAKADSLGCVVAAICAAPAVLARAGLLNMKMAVSHPSVSDELLSAGAVIADGAVATAGNFVTAVGPAAAGDFARQVVSLIASRPGEIS